MTNISKPEPDPPPVCVVLYACADCNGVRFRGEGGPQVPRQSLACAGCGKVVWLDLAEHGSTRPRFAPAEAFITPDGKARV